MEFTHKELERYSRQLILPEIGKEGQVRLKKARVLIVGAGGLGSPAIIYLAAAGVGTLGIIDSDKVDLSNLHRQIIHSTEDIAKQKVFSAQEKIAKLNPEIKINPYPERFRSENALSLISHYDLVIDGTDNFSTRYLINDACILAGKPFIFGGVFRFEGQVSVFGLDDGPCYRCLFEEPPRPEEVPSCAEAGVLGVLPGIIGLLQANEAIKMISHIGEPLKGKLLIFDALSTRFREIPIKKNPDCAICSDQRRIHELREYAAVCEQSTKPNDRREKSLLGSLFNRDPVPEITVRELKKIMDQKNANFCLVDVREQREWEIAYIQGAILKPTSSFQKEYQNIPKDIPVYIYCKAGGRSFKAVKFLKEKGYTNALYNVKGGIDAWAKEIDPQMPKY